MKDRKDDNTINKTVVNEQTGEERLITLHRDHPKPTTRRDFLASGMIGMSGFIVAPSILNVLAAPGFANAQDDQCVVTGGGMPAFITVNLSGGASLSGNLPPLGEDRDPLPKYDILGLGADQAVFTDDTRGSTMFQGVRVAGTRNAGVPAGHFWLGLGLRASQATIDKTSLVSICVSSNDDTSSNLADASGMIMQAGLSGSLLPNLGQSNGTGTGVGQTAAITKPAAPLIVGRYSDIEGALKPAGTLATRLTDSRRKKLLELVNSLSGSQARTVASPGSATGTMLAKVVECATGKNIELAATTDPGIDPGLNTGVAGVWGIAPGNKNGANYAAASIVYNALNGNASTAGINLGGYDYHGNARNNTNTADQRAGEMVGQILETASILGKTVMIYVVSDGSVSAASGSAFGVQYSNDSGSRGMSYMLVYNPTARPQVKNDAYKHQIGFFTNGQGASDQTPVATATKAAAAVVANYLQIAGQSAKLDGIIGSTFQRSELDEVIRFG